MPSVVDPGYKAPVQACRGSGMGRSLCALSRELRDCAEGRVSWLPTGILILLIDFDHS